MDIAIQPKRYKHSEETKGKIRAARLGKRLSKETIEKVRQAKLGKPTPLRGRTYEEIYGDNWKEIKRRRFSNPYFQRQDESATCFRCGKIWICRAKENKRSPNRRFCNWLCYFLTIYRGGNEKKWEIRQRRDRIRLLNGGCHSLMDWENLKVRYNYRCPCCKKFEPEIRLTEDHIIPFSKGGSDNIENIQPLCRSCNSKKFTKILKYEYSL